MAGTVAGIYKTFAPLVDPVLRVDMYPALAALFESDSATSAFRHTVEQGVVIGLNAYFIWKYYILAVLFLHVLNSFIYFGAAPIWGYIAQTGRWLMLPLSRLPPLGRTFGPSD